MITKHSSQNTPHRYEPQHNQHNRRALRHLLTKRKFTVPVAVTFIALATVAVWLNQKTLIEPPIKTQKPAPALFRNTSERLLDRTGTDFDSIFTKKALVPASHLLSAADRAQTMLSGISLSKSQHALVLARLENGKLCDYRIAIGKRPEPSHTEIAASGNATFRISRVSKDDDPSGIFSQMRVMPYSNASGDWYVIGAKVFAESRQYGSRHFIVTPNSPRLNSGEIALQGLRYLLEIDSTARNAIRKFSGNARVVNMLECIPPHMNVLIALIEQVGPENLGDAAKFKAAVSRFLYHAAMHTNQSKFMSTSSAGARGPFQFMPKTRADLLRAYKNDPNRVFDLWAGTSAYPPRNWLGERNMLGDGMYSAILAYYHHIDVLTNLAQYARNAGINPKSVLYSSTLQTACAIALGYNGGAQMAWKRIQSSRYAKSGQPWQQTAFENGANNIESLRLRVNENLGYLVKTYVMHTGVTSDSYTVDSAHRSGIQNMLSRINPSSPYNMKVPYNDFALQKKGNLSSRGSGGKKGRRHSQR